MILKYIFGHDFEAEIWLSFWGLSLVKLLKRSVDNLKGNNFCGSHQPFGPLCLWQYSSFSLNCLNQYLVLSLFKESNFSHNLNFQSVSHSTLALDHVKLTQQQILGGLGLKWWQNKIASHKTARPLLEHLNIIHFDRIAWRLTHFSDFRHFIWSG